MNDNYDVSLGDDLLDADPVVSERDVFVNASHYDDTMIMLTHPTTPCTRPRPLFDAESGRWQRVQKAFKFDLKKAPSQAPAQPMMGVDDVANFKRALASRVVPLAANYAVGVVSASGDLHLTPCNVAVDLLPDLSHIDERNAVDRAKKEQEARDEAAELEEMTVRDQDGELTIGRGYGGIHSASSVAASMNQKAAANDTADSAATTTNTAAGDQSAATTATNATAASTSDASKTIREHTYEHMVAVANEEPWHALDVSRRLDRSSLECAQPHQRYDCEQLVPADDIDWYEQASRLLPGTRRTDAWTRPGASQQARSQAALSRLSLVQQVAQIMRQEQTLSFSAVAEKATRVVDDGGLLDALKHVAVMVRGRWIAKSNLVCGGNQVLETARNYILYMFATATHAHDEVNLARNDEPGVDAAAMAEQTGLLAARANGLIEAFAKRRSPGSKEFVLRIDRDRDFLSRHPRVAAIYDEYWVSMRDELATGISQVVKGTSVEVEKNVHFELGVRHDALFALEPADLGGDTGEQQLNNFLVAMFTHFGICSRALLESTLEVLKTEPKFAPLITTAHEWSDDMADWLAVHAIEVQPGVFCRKQVGDPKIDQYRDVIIGLLKVKPEVKRSEIMEELRKQQKAINDAKAKASAANDAKEAANASTADDAQAAANASTASDAKKAEPEDKKATTKDEVGLMQIPAAIYTRICRELADSVGAKWVLKNGSGVLPD